MTQTKQRPGNGGRGAATDRGRSGADDTAPWRQSVPLARAVGLAPSGARKLWLWIVGRCDFCGGAHAHRGGPKGGVRRAGCGRGEYEVTASRKRERRAV